MRRQLFALWAIGWVAETVAAPPASLSFTHKDWQVVCDNTRTCRAAGYQRDDQELAISVLLTRTAGPSQPVTGDLMLGEYGEVEQLSALPASFDLRMTIDGESVGQIAMTRQVMSAELQAAQVHALLRALRRDSRIEFDAGPLRWRLSDSGATAVLLKMDEFQGRLNTPGALIRRGDLAEERALPALPLPVLTAVPFVVEPAPAREFLGMHEVALRSALRASMTSDDYCPDLMEISAAYEPESDQQALDVTRLTKDRLLISTQCWQGAYNIGTGYWVIRPEPPFAPELVTTSGSELAGSQIIAAHKGRGLGDCWHSDAWTWDGRRFVHTERSSSGLCKLIAPGGAWQLPEIIYQLR